MALKLSKRYEAGSALYVDAEKKISLSIDATFVTPRTGGKQYKRYCASGWYGKKKIQAGCGFKTKGQAKKAFLKLAK